MASTRPVSLTATVGVFLLVAVIYALAGPGRIDMIDGQYRFEVARNIIDRGSVQLYDPHLLGGVVGVNGVYSSYGLSGSLVAVPMVLLGKSSGISSVDREQFFFSFTSAVFGAAAAALLFVFYTNLGVSVRAALAWTFVSAFATLTFPQSTTVFDQVQQGFFVLAACFLGWLGARRDSMGLTVAGGAALAILVNFQEAYAILIPTLALVTLDRPESGPVPRRRVVERFAVFVFVAGLGLLFYAGFNNFRYGSLLFSGKGVNHPTVLGNPLIGLAGLLVSPGKSIVLYSPPILIALIGVYRLVRAHRYLALAIAMTCVVYIGLISTLSFYGGDWCWGPRYFVTILPLVAIGLPFAAMRRWVALAIVITGLCVQLLALSLDHHRFFYSRSLPSFFWSTQRDFYFRDSALFARPAEIVDSIRNGVPPQASRFRPGPYPDLVTYAVFGPAQDDLPPPLWMRHFRVFWQPRPWPLWMRSVSEERRPVTWSVAVVALLGMGMCGAWMVRSSAGARRRRRTS